MTAYGAVISLKNTIQYILHSSHFTLVEPSPTIIQLASNELKPLKKLLKRLDITRTSKSRKQVNALDGRIKQKIWEFEDLLESLLHQQILSQVAAAETSVWRFPGLLKSLPSEFQFQSPPAAQLELATRRRRVVHKHKGGRLLKSTRRTPIRRRSRDVLLFSIDLQSLEDDVASFIQELKDMKREYIYELENMPQEPIATTIGFDFGGTKSKMIGLSDQFQQIKDHLMPKFQWKEVHALVGMAGIGKTTLAKELYEDPDIVSYYDCRAWVTVTRTMVDEGPQFDQVLQGIVAQLCDGDALIQGDDQSIGNYLEGKKCFLVLDDVWEKEVFYCLEKSLPDIKNGSFYILLTARGISGFNVRKTEVRFLDEGKSKDLLCHKVFGDKDLCPDQLDKAATKIAKKCEGLPLMIVTVAAILSKSQNTEPAYWNEVAEERNSVFKDAYNEISKVLFPSYDYLPQHLKMPFLFMGVFPPVYNFPPSKLINMFTAEGWFLDYSVPPSKLINVFTLGGWLFDTYKKQSPKEFVWKCLNELCEDKKLLLFNDMSIYRHVLELPPRRYKTCRLHSSWRHVCRVEARKNKFYHVLNKLVDGLEEDVKGQRGLCLGNNMLFGINELRNSVRLNCASSRSLLFWGPYHQYPIPIDVGFKLLRELDALQLRFYTFPTEILTLVHLKYLALVCNGELPTTISKLFNLQVLIIHPHIDIRCCRAPSHVPIQIWDMQELVHIEILGKSLLAPSHVASLGKLSTLVGVNANISTILELSRRIPNIRKLVVQIELMPYDDHNDLLSVFLYISTLESLETLKCSIINPVVKNDGYVFPAPPGSLMLPRGLKKLHLSGMAFRGNTWMSLVLCHILECSNCDPTPSGVQRGKHKREAFRSLNIF